MSNQKPPDAVTECHRPLLKYIRQRQENQKLHPRRKDTNGGHRAAIHYSLVSSAKANGVEPFAWLKELFTRLPYHRNGEAFEQATNELPVESNELDYLLPDIWLAENPEHKWTIDQIRREERNRKSV